jgi:hypothetical protein
MTVFFFNEYFSTTWVIRREWQVVSDELEVTLKAAIVACSIVSAFAYSQ